MAATLASIDEALFAALAKINPAAAYGATAGTARESTVRYIGRWSGEPIRVSQAVDYYRAAVQREVDGKTPAILLGFDGESVDPRPNNVQTMAGNVETVATSTWSVLIVVRETRGTKPTMQGTPAGAATSLGIFDIEARVEAALTNLGITGLYRSTNVCAYDSRPFLIALGEMYVLILRFTARRVMLDAREEGTDEAYDALGQVPFSQLTASFNIYPQDLAGDVMTNPIVEATAYPGGPLLPPTIPPLRGLTAWFDAAAFNGIDPVTLAPLPGVNDLQAVPLWRDRHSDKWLVAQADPDAQPHREDVSGVPYVEFALGDSFAGALDWVPVDAQARTVAVVVTDFSDLAATQALVGWGSSAGTALYDWDVLLTNGATYSPGVSTGTAVVSSGYTLVSGPVLIIASYSGTVVTVRVVPASGTGASASSTVTLDTRDQRSFRIARGGLLQAKIGAVLLWRNTLTADETTALLAWVSSAYGIAGS